ncbi:MAG TPA: hypothetical protein PLH19_00190 [Anaerolineae bacterium]|nr:hypothetical protein [Anaerolineae bacterium]HQH36940.1 hypothetical protein [Anaerolineae bacterium]
MSQLPYLLQQAEQAMTEGDWEKAQRLYQQARDLDANNPKADQGLRLAQRAVEKEAEIKERLTEADALMAQGDYRNAADEYIAITDFAVASPRILKFHTDLEHKRNQALDLHNWQTRVHNAQAEIRKVNAVGDWEAAANAAADMLRQLPQEPVYQPLRSELENVRTNALSQGDHQALLRKAEEALRAREFEQGIMLLENIPQASPLYAQAQGWLRQARSYLDSQKRDLAAIEKAIAESRWTDALAQLEQQRSRYQDVPLWQQLYLQAGMTYGRQLLEAGRQQNQQRSFDQAKRQFEGAQKVFEEVLTIYPAHLDATGLRDESVDLVAITAQQKQARLDWDEGRRDEAAQSLKLALQRLTHAKSEGRDYTAVGAVVETMHNTVTAEIRRIEEEAGRLRNAESLWECSDLSKARALFEETLGALLPEHQRQAAEGLRRVEAKIEKFNALMGRGKAANDVFVAVRAYQEAHEVWAAGPGVTEALESQLVQACESAFNAGRLTEAAGYGNEALGLNPDNNAAKACVGMCGAKPKAEATLAQVKKDWAALQQQATLQAGALDPLLQDLESALHLVADWPDLCAGLEALHTTLRAARDAWQDYETAHTRAEQSRDKGEWGAAVVTLKQAVEAMGDSAPSGARRQLHEWEALARELEAARSAAGAALSQAQVAYAAAADGETPVEIADALDDAALRHVEPARKRLEEVETQATDAGGLLPAELSTLQKQLKDLDERATAAADAARNLVASDGLLKIQEVIKMRGSDPTLEAVRAQLEEKAREKINSTKLAAQTAIQSGDLTEAEEKLRLVRELDPSDTETAKLYAEIRQRRMLEEKLRAIEREAEEQQASSPMDAMRTWRRGLNTLLEPDVALPQQVREILNQLTQMGDRDDGLALGQADHWQTAQDRLGVLGNLRQESWAAGRAQFFVDQWIRLAHDNALRGVIASATQLGQLIDAYRAATEYIKGHPRDAEAIQQLTDCTEALINRANEAADKRVQRAQNALNAGEFQAALHNLQDIEQEFYNQIDHEFPTLLEGQPSVQEIREAITQFQEKAEKLQALDEKARPEIEKARQAYLNNEWDAAEKALETLPALKELPDLDAEVQKLHEQIANARVEATRKTLHDVMSQIETGRHLATTVEQLSDYLNRLDKLQKEINLQVLDVDERNRYFQVLSDVRQQREDWAAGAVWEEQIEVCRQEQDYAGALRAVNETLKTLREGHKRPYLEMLRDELEKLAAGQQERDAALKEGQAALDAEKYAEARMLFEKAVRLGATEAGDLLRAARAGAKLQSAQRWWNEERQADNALLDLTDLERFAENNRYAESIAEEAGYLRQRIEEARESTLGMQRALAEAQQWLANGQFKEAQDIVQKILESDPASKEALALQTQIREQRITQEMLEKARTAQQTGKYKEALQLVETVLEKRPDDPEARLLKRQLEAVINADKTFLQVEALAKQERFKEARELLTDLSRQNVDPEKFNKTQQLVDELEKEQWTRVVHPIQELYRDGEYAEAWNRCKQATGRTAAPELLDELQTLQNLIVNRWAEKQAQTARGQLQKRLEQEQLRDLEAQLKPFLILDPPPESHWVRQFEDLLRETRTRRLRLRLEEARERFESWRREGMRGTPQAALDIVKAVQEEAEALGVQVEFDITLDAASLAAEIHEAHQGSIRARLEQDYNQKMAAARALQSQLEDAGYIAKKSPGRIDLERLESAVKEVFQVKGYENDGPARELATWVRNALDTFERTQDAMKRARDLAGNKRFRDAEIELRGAGVSLLLKTAYERQREIISALSRAEVHQNNEAWDLALQEYRRVLELDANFEPAPDKDMERCYQRLRERVVAEVTDFLNQTPPDTVAARAKLTQAETAGWITPLVSRDYDRLRNWLASQECVAQAAALLQAPEGNLAEAKKALEEAERLCPGDQPDTPIRQWELLLEALEAWEAYQQRPSLLSRTLDVFKALPPDISKLGRAQTLRHTLEEKAEQLRIQKEKEAAEAQRQEAEAAESRQLLDKLKREIGTFLGTPKDYAGAVQTLEHASPQITHETAFTEQCLRVRDDLRMTMEVAIKELKYVQALECADILRQVPQLDQDTRDWAAGLPGEQTAAFNAQLQKAETALQRLDEQGVHSALADAAQIIKPEADRQGRIADLRARLQNAKLDIALDDTEKALVAYDPAGATTALEKAIRIAAPRTDKRLDDLAERIRALRTLLDRVHDDLRELHTEIGAKQWAVAVTRILRVRGEAPDYPRVQSAIKDLQDRLKTHAEVERRAGEFTHGLELCDLALRLDPRDDIRTLQQQIREEQEAALVKIRQQIQAGLDAWRLSALPGLFTQGFKIAPADVDLLNLRERFETVEALLPDLRHAMNQGWDSLLSRDYPTAITAYNQVLSMASSFSEAQIWRDYTQALREAVRRVQDDAAFERAAWHLRAAEGMMHVTTGQALPDVLGSEAHLKERRRHAVYNAWLLRQSVLRMTAFYKATNYYFEQQDTDTMNMFYDRIADESKRFQEVHLKPLTPPETFPASGNADDPLPADAILPSHTAHAQSAGSERQESPEAVKATKPDFKPAEPPLTGQPIGADARPSLRDVPKTSTPAAAPESEPSSGAGTPVPLDKPGKPEMRSTQAAPSLESQSETPPDAEMPASSVGPDKSGMRSTQVAPSPEPAPSIISPPELKPSTDDESEVPMSIFGAGWWANSENYDDEDTR